jgi:hypothetical protein
MAFADLIDEQNMVNFHPLMIEDKRLMSNLVYNFDKANGYMGTKKREGEEFGELRDSMAE